MFLQLLHPFMHLAFQTGMRLARRSLWGKDIHETGNNLESRLGKTNFSNILFLAFLLLLVEHSLTNSFILLIVEGYMNHYGSVLACALPINVFGLFFLSWIHGSRQS